MHRSGLKRLHHPVAGDLDLTYESLPLASTPGLTLNVYTAPPGSPTADALAILGSWAATQREEFLALDSSVLGPSVQAG
ncbi:hypothetical protein [Demequina litorisediminis]|uniref:MmyB-like transcription regulator ligand binding domain-containing protein n=1 Tax=Demequina litorisediminis TaxID=1849022 RepID=A0ABQ6I975_9MICO|nr:hypothetical protein GCM10025876_05490 [Demequina litorisediminis]